jgi:hypothetical protein
MAQDTDAWRLEQARVRLREANDFLRNLDTPRKTTAKDIAAIVRVIHRIEYHLAFKTTD